MINHQGVIETEKQKLTLSLSEIKYFLNIYDNKVKHLTFFVILY
jgi:hypothetical protein